MPMTIGHDPETDDAEVLAADTAQARYLLRLRQLKAAVLSTYRTIDAEGWTSGRVARVIGCSPSTYRKLASDGDATGWAPPSRRMCEAVDTFGRDRMGKEFGLAALRCQMKTAEAESKASTVLRRAAGDAEDLAEARGEAYQQPLVRYLESLRQSLLTTSRWLPYSDVSEGFESRAVTVSDTPPEFIAGDDLHGAAGHTLRGDVGWLQAVTEVAVAVVLADAGAGKTWLLRDYGRVLCDDALAACLAGHDPAEIALPVVVHAADLAACWGTSDSPARAFVTAAARGILTDGRTLSSLVAALLSERIAGNGLLNVLVDGYDEVFDDGPRARLRQSLAWLQQQCGEGTRLVLMSRRAGFDDPFSVRAGTGVPSPRYMQLGLLEDAQVRGLWRQWFAARGQSVPLDRLEPAVTPQSPLRRFVQVPLIAAFCAWVAETEVVESTRAGLYGQVVRKFISQQWKRDSPHMEGGLQQDAARRTSLESSLTDLAWHMATSRMGWLDALPIDEVDRVLARQGPGPLPGRSHAWEPIRRVGILVQPGSFGDEPLGDAPVMWIHRSVHEFLSASRLASLPSEDIRGLVDRGMWFHSSWANVLDFAVGVEASVGEGDGQVTRLLRELALSEDDGLGWFAAVFASASAGLPPDPGRRHAVVDRVWRLHNAGLLTSIHLARVLALVPEADTQDIIEQLRMRPPGESTRREVLEAIAWCGEQGRSLLATEIESSPEAAGAASALFRVDPPRAVEALNRRIVSGLALHSADGCVIREIDSVGVKLLVERYLADVTSAERATALAWTHAPIALDTFTSADLLRSPDSRIRAVAAHGLSIWYRNDLDRAGFKLLVDLALRDPDPTVRIQVRSGLDAVGMTVPWVESALHQVFTELHTDPALPEITDLDTLAATLQTTGPAFMKALVMVREEPRLLQGPVIDAIQLLTVSALLGKLGVMETRDVLIIGGPEIIALAADRICGDTLSAAEAGQVAVGLSFAARNDPDVYSSIVIAAGRHSHPILAAALRLHEGLVDGRIAALAMAIQQLGEPRPRAVQTWASVLRALLLELPYEQRQSWHEACGRATAHVLKLESGSGDRVFHGTPESAPKA